MKDNGLPKERVAIYRAIQSRLRRKLFSKKRFLESNGNYNFVQKQTEFPLILYMKINILR
jgi:CelD/BcsL family acetyltransferase involved in cellulose biosynthesis